MGMIACAESREPKREATSSAIDQPSARGPPESEAGLGLGGRGVRHWWPQRPGAEARGLSARSSLPRRSLERTPQRRAWWRTRHTSAPDRSFAHTDRYRSVTYDLLPGALAMADAGRACSRARRGRPSADMTGQTSRVWIDSE